MRGGNYRVGTMGSTFHRRCGYGADWGKFKVWGGGWSIRVEDGRLTVNGRPDFDAKYFFDCGCAF